MPARAQSGLSLARRLARICFDKKATGIVLLDMRKTKLLTDYFLLCSTESEKQSRAIAEECMAQLKEKGAPLPTAAGLDSGGWVVLDSGSVVCHIFRKDLRQFYNLEGLWEEAPRIPLKLAARTRRKPRTSDAPLPE